MDSHRCGASPFSSSWLTRNRMKTWSLSSFAIPLLCPVRRRSEAHESWCVHSSNTVKAGHSLDRFLEGFHTVSREHALQALEKAKESLLVSR